MRAVHEQDAGVRGFDRSKFTGKRIRAGLGRRARVGAQRVRAWLPHRPPPAILMYHRIAEESFDPWGLCVSAANFRDQLSWLSSNRTVLSLKQFAALRRENRLPGNAVAVTFDDGYSCNLDVAAPVLREFRVPATIFLPASLIEHGGPFWWDELETLVLGHPGATLSLDGEAIDLGERTPEDSRWLPGAPPRTARQRAFLYIHERIARRTPSAVNEAMAELRTQAESATALPPLKRPILPSRAMRPPDFVEFGSHTLSHPWLPSLDASEQREEICGSVEACQALTGGRPSTFAYPFGMFDERAERLAEEAGFDCACATRDLAVSTRSHVFALPRVGVPNSGAEGLERLLSRVRAE